MKDYIFMFTYLSFIKIAYWLMKSTYKHIKDLFEFRFDMFQFRLLGKISLKN